MEAGAATWTSDTVSALRVLGMEAGVATWSSDAIAAMGVLGVEAGAATRTSDTVAALPPLASWETCATESPLYPLLLTSKVIAPVPS